MTATIATPIRTAAQLVAEALGLVDDTRIRVEITRGANWDFVWCEETGRPAAVTVSWCTWDGDEASFAPTDRTVAGDIAGGFINTIAASDQTDPCETITVEVSRQWVRYIHPNIADAL
ncbi:hypothetical protein [Nocardia miyunensis]|uniref:hypothetical protein n=1 Tax=Nocardia miyunensis TaxID=282684 RepID=UPI0008349809|nr:hypothetical protein [Nocardia miyunensis]